MSAPSVAVDDVQLYLVDRGIVDGVSVWASVQRFMHDESPDRLVVITEDGGPPPELPAADGSLGDSAMADCGVRMIVRGAPDDQDDAIGKAQQIIDALHGLFNFDMGNGHYLRIRSLTAHPVSLGYDERRRQQFSLAFRMMRRVSVPTT